MNYNFKTNNILGMLDENVNKILHFTWCQKFTFIILLFHMIFFSFIIMNYYFTLKREEENETERTTIPWNSGENPLKQQNEGNDGKINGLNIILHIYKIQCDEKFMNFQHYYFQRNETISIISHHNNKYNNINWMYNITR